MFSLYEEASYFLNYFLDNYHQYTNRTQNVKLPYVEPTFLIQFLPLVKSLFEVEPILLELEGSFVIMGDIHGQLIDLLRIISTFPFDNSRKYLLLGNLIDEGEFSFETVFIVFLLKCSYPSNIFII
jgi:protein phosphatase